jgi:hypothetical protein
VNGDPSDRTTDPVEDESLWPVFRFVVAALAVGCTALTVWFLSYPGGLPGDLGAMALAIVLYLAWPVLLLAVVAGLLLVAAPRWRRTLARADVALVSLGVALLALGAASWLGAALRVRLALSDDALEQRALAFRRGEEVDGAAGAGLYDVLRVHDGPGGSVVLVTNRCGLGDCGFAYSPGRRPPGVCGDSNYEVYTPLTGPWYVAELYPSGPCG